MNRRHPSARWSNEPQPRPNQDTCGHPSSTFDRFGYEVCDTCHKQLMWSPLKVRDGLYGNDTDAYIINECNRVGNEGVRPEEIDAALRQLSVWPDMDTTPVHWVAPIVPMFRTD